MTPKTLKAGVVRIRREATDVASFELAPIDGNPPLPSFTPGSHIDVHIAPEIIRQYSLCNGPHETAHYLVAVKKEPQSRGGSRTMHEKLKEGSVITIGTPRNNFHLDWAAKHQLLLAGGIGITPLLSMAKHLLAGAADFHLQYFARSIDHMAFHEHLSGPQFKDKVTFHYALEPEAVRSYLRKLLSRRPEGGHLYLCGPRLFMDQVETTAAATWPPEAIHLEYFTADPLSLAGVQQSFEVTLARSGATYLIPEGRTITEVLAERGIRIEVSCEQGVCGTCLTGVLSGTPDHRDVFLSDEEKRACDKMTPCISRAKSKTLVLDL